MDRRSFIKSTAAIAAVAALSDVISPEAKAVGAKKPSPRKPKVYSSEQGVATSEDILVRFLGTGAADWHGKDERGEQRRLSSVLVDGKFLIDYTRSCEDMLPEGFQAGTIFYTHSHSDHYNPSAALKLGINKVYVSDTWFERAKWDFKSAAAKTGKPMPEIVALAIGQSVEEGGVKVTAMPANHASGYEDEQTLIYLLEKGPVRVVYATDTGGITVRAARIAGIDAHIKEGKPISGFIMEATMGIDHDEDFRIFTHSSVGTVARTSHIMLETGRLVAPEGQPVYITHMARTLNGTQAELDASLPEPLRAAYDGLEVIFRKA